MFKLVKEIKSRTGDLHFRRYRVIETSWFSIYLHYIAKSDEDIHPHSHPWNFWSLILNGGYTESVWEGKIFVEKPTYTRKRGWLSLRYTNREHYHKLVLDKPTWTLVLCGRKSDFWGYATENGHMHHTFYRDLKNNMQLSLDNHLLRYKIFGKHHVSMGNTSTDEI